MTTVANVSAMKAMTAIIEQVRNRTFPELLKKVDNFSVKFYESEKKKFVELNVILGVSLGQESFDFLRMLAEEYEATFCVQIYVSQQSCMLARYAIEIKE